LLLGFPKSFADFVLPRFSTGGARERLLGFAELRECLAIFIVAQLDGAAT
jgi:hypothetical protein